MIEVYPNLLVGSEEDYISYTTYTCNGYNAVIHACKEPYHREKLGYTTRGAPKDIGDYYYFVEDYIDPPGYHELTLNIVDANDIKFIPEILFIKAFQFIDEHIKNGRVLLHCNRGESRSVGIAMSYLHFHTDFFNGCYSYEEQYRKFLRVYPQAKMGRGVTDMVKRLYAQGLTSWDNIVK